MCYLDNYSFVSPALILRSIAGLDLTTKELKENRIINGNQHM